MYIYIYMPIMRDIYIYIHTMICIHCNILYSMLIRDQIGPKPQQAKRRTANDPNSLHALKVTCRKILSRIKMLGLCRGYIGIRDNKMETTISRNLGLIFGFLTVVEALHPTS